MLCLGIPPLPHQAKFVEYCATEAARDNVDAMIVMAWFCLGKTGSAHPDSIGKANEAAALLNRALARARENKFFVLLGLGKARMSVYHALGAAAGGLQQAEVERLLDDAIEKFEASRKLRPGFAPTLFELARSLVRRGRVTEALQVSEQLVRHVPNSPRAHSQRSEILRLLGSKLAAIEELRLACGLNRYGAWDAMQLGDLYAETGRLEEAIEVYRRALEQNDPAGAILEWQLHCSIARCLVVLRRYDEAVEAYRHALHAAGEGAGVENRRMLEQELAAALAAVPHP